jgi:aryl-alcohol dehydrogenase-like predicted oxidoreductase
MLLKGIKDSWKVLLLMGIGVFINHDNISYTEIMKKLALNGDLIYVRSIYLQGLLLMEPSNIPKEFSKILATVEKLVNFAKLCNISKEALCLSYARNIPWATGLIIGVASLSQLEKLLEPVTVLPQDFESHIPSIEEEFLDPRNWPQIG